MDRMSGPVHMTSQPGLQASLAAQPIQGASMANQPQHGSSGPLQPTARKPRRRMLSSLPLQVLIYFGGWWDVLYYVLNILVFVYKGVNLPYPQRNFSMEFCFAWLWVLIEAPRLFLASKGNKSEHAGPLVFSFILGAPLLAMYVYFISYQTYVLKIDEFLNGAALFFLGGQVLLGLVACFKFVMATRFA